MPKAHPRPYRRDSAFGPGPRRPLDREQRARFRYLLNAHRRARRLTPTTELIGNALVRRLGVNGQLDPSHDTIAEDAGCSSRTVRRALATLKALGLVMWQCRLVRAGARCAQTSNAYLLSLAGAGTLPTFSAPRCGGHFGHQTKTLLKQGLTYLLPSDQSPSMPPPPLSPDMEAALARLGRAIEDVQQGSGS